MLKLALIGFAVFSGLAFAQESQEAPKPSPKSYSLGISEVKISLEDSTESAIKSISLKQPKKIDGGFLADKGQILKLHFFASKVDEAGAIASAAKLDMAAVMMNHTETGTVTYVPFGTSKEGSYRLNLGKKNFPKFIQANPGSYELTLLLAATKELGGIYYPLGEVQFNTPKASEATSSVERYGPRTPISHTFRQPEPTPNFVIPYTFTGILAVPWVFLITSWAKLGVNVSEFPWSRFGHLVAALGFLASLAANIALSYYYWVSLPLFPTLALFGAISVVTVITGRFALDHVQNRRNMTLK